MAAPPKPSAVASIIVSGSEDPAEKFRSGRFDLSWKGENVKKFREVKIVHNTNENLVLPTLYLHFLDQDFRESEKRDELDKSLRAGNDMAELIIKLPSAYTSEDFMKKCDEHGTDFGKHVRTVIKALQGQGEMWVSHTTRGTTTPVQPDTLFFSLKTSRPKAEVNLPKPKFGIPESADQYLFVNNHDSVVHFDLSLREAFNEVIGQMPSMGEGFPPAAKMATFVKVFYEGGFGYNKKLPMGGGYLPVNVGIAALGVTPAFEDQVGIGTGYPYVLSAPFLPFVETVPVSIDAISSMSEYHGRYGLAFTRLVWVWEGDEWEASKTLDFCSILPHGGFYYVPSTMSQHQEKGGLVYSFGEKAEASGPELAQ